MPPNPDRPSALGDCLGRLLPGAEGLEAVLAPLLVDEVTAGFRGDVGVVPRQFLREFVNQLDLVDEHEGYDPLVEYGFKPEELRPEEREVLYGRQGVEDDETGLVPQEDVW